MNITTPWTARNGHSNGATDKLEDVRDALGREADHLAQVVAQMGHEAGAQADTVVRDVTRDAQKQTGAAVNRLADIAATLGPAIAVIGRQKMRQVGEQAQSLGHELRQVRVTKEPPRSDALPGVTLIGGLGIGVGTGIALMYLLDPERGQARRANLMDKLSRWLRGSRKVAAAKAGDFTNRTVGVISDVRQSVTNAIGNGDEPLVADELETAESPQETRVSVA